MILKVSIIFKDSVPATEHYEVTMWEVHDGVLVLSRLDEGIRTSGEIIPLDRIASANFEYVEE